MAVAVAPPAPLRPSCTGPREGGAAGARSVPMAGNQLMRTASLRPRGERVAGQGERMSKIEVPVALARAAVALAAVARTAAAVALGFRPFDDTYITLRYARNLAAGEGFVYNLGERVLGTTTPLWSWMLALAELLGFSMERFAMLVSVLLDGVSALAVFELLRGRARSLAAPLGGALLLLGSFDLLSISRSGMEMSLFVALVASGFLALDRERLVAGGTCMGLAMLTRPEGAAAAGIFALLALWKDGRVSRRVVWGWMSLALPALLWAGWASAYFGSPIPQSVAAKVQMAAADPGLRSYSLMNLRQVLLLGQTSGSVFTPSVLQLNALWTCLGAVGALAAIGNFVRDRRAAKTVGLGAVVAFVAAYLGAHGLGGGFTWFPWYYAPVYALGAPVVALGVGSVAERLSRGAPRLRVALVAGMVGLLLAGQIAAAVWVKIPADSEYWVEGYRAVVASVPNHGAGTVAAPEIGVVGWEVWPRPVLDLVGLVSPGVIGMTHAQAVRELAPEYLCLRTDDGARLLTELEGSGWLPRNMELIAVEVDPRGGREFRLYRRRET